MTNTTDTVQVLLKALETATTEKLDIINKVDSFYNSAWTKLIFGFAIVGIIAPILIQIYQNWFIKKDTKRLLEKINTTIDEKIKIANKDFDIRIDESRKENNKSYNQIQGALFHLQAISNGSMSGYKESLNDCIISIQFYFTAEDYNNLNNVLSIIDTIIPKLKKNDIELLNAKNIDIFNNLEQFINNDKNKIFNLRINKIKEELHNLQ